MDQPEVAVSMLNAFVHEESAPFKSTNADAAASSIPAVTQ